MSAIQLNRRGFLFGLGAAGLAASAPGRASGQRSLLHLINRPLGVQLYALGPLAQTDLGGTLKRLMTLGYGDFELPGLYGRRAAELRADADTAGARFNSIHLPLKPPPPGGLTLLSSTQEIADALGALHIGAAVLPAPPVTAPLPAGIRSRDWLATNVNNGGADLWKRLAETLNQRASALKSQGIAVGYHNHNMEFRPLGGTTGWNLLVDELDPGLVFFEFDIGWAAAAGIDTVAELRRLKGRVRMAHLKDIRRSPVNYAMLQEPIEIGLGTLDWRSILHACAEIGVQHYYVEQEAPFVRDRFESMQLSHDYLARTPA